MAGDTDQGKASGAARNPGDEAAPGSPQTGEALCPRCGGAGQIENAPCGDCGGTGRVVAIVGDA